MILPKQLQNENYRFIPLGYIESDGTISVKKPKNGLTKWSTTNNLKHNDIMITKHNGNIGVVLGIGNLVAIDTDEESFKKDMEVKLNDTFTVQTGSGGKHFYVELIDGPISKFVIFDPIRTDEEGNSIHLGEVQGTGSQVVAPGSIHPNGNIYKVVNDIPIKKINKEELMILFKDYKNDSTKSKPIEVDNELNDLLYNNDDPILKEIKDKLKISDFLKGRGLWSSSQPGPCPMGHPSKGGKCFNVTDEKGMCGCFHCRKSWTLFGIRMALDKIDMGECVKRFCNELRIKPIKDNEETNRTPIEHPREGRLISDVASEYGKVLKDKDEMFYRQELGSVVEIKRLKNETDGKVFEGFSEIEPSEFVTRTEKFIFPYVVKKDKDTNKLYKKSKSISSELSNTILVSNNLQDELKHIKRILTYPLPIIKDGNLTFPKEGFDERFNTWLCNNSPKIDNVNMSLEEANNVIKDIYGEYCFKSKQDFTNAVSALLTPFIKGLYPQFNCRQPCFFFRGNRERSGKDHCQGVTTILYTGEALEEGPVSIGENSVNGSEEFRKKILTLLKLGRVIIHFSNNKGFIDNASLESFLTASTYSDRLLGGNESLKFDNETNISLSGNVGIGLSADLQNRCRFINLHLDIEDANSRKFNRPNLHQYVKDNRNKILSALYTLVRNWVENGSPDGSKVFTSFPEWARIVGGILESAGYDSPCNEDEEINGISINPELTEMKNLFTLCYLRYPEQEIEQSDIKKLLNEKDSGFEHLDLEDKSLQTKFWTKVRKFFNRILSNIRLEVKNSNDRISRVVFKFTKKEQTDTKEDIFRLKTGHLDTLDTSPTQEIENKNNNIIQTPGVKGSHGLQVSKKDDLVFKGEKKEVQTTIKTDENGIEWETIQEGNYVNTQ